MKKTAILILILIVSITACTKHKLIQEKPFPLYEGFPYEKTRERYINDGFREDNLIEGGSKVKVTLILSENYDLNEAVTYLEQRYGASLKAATPRYAEGFVSVDNIDSLLRDDRVVFLEESPGKPVDLNND